MKYEDRCNHSIEGPPVGHSGVVAWRRTCKRKAGKGSSYCWQHAPYHKPRR